MKHLEKILVKNEYVLQEKSGFESLFFDVIYLTLKKQKSTIRPCI